MSSHASRKQQNFTVHESGARQAWPDQVVRLPGVELPGKAFLRDKLGLTGCEISINSLKPGAGMPFYHAHQQNEEIYIFIQGSGQLQVDDEVIEVREGTTVRIAPAGMRTWRNNSNEPLLYIVIQARENSLQQCALDDSVLPQRAVSWS